MARPLRIELSGGLYHVTSRGERREAEVSPRINPPPIFRNIQLMAPVLVLKRYPAVQT